ncbi:sulfotransferase domain-containing protein [Vibrio sp. H11]|uniref:sulfotransferase domain-containing protein n=1 Tax=Vibrio sp. H11 TaxID=2565928 RepID=UPI0010A5C11F|nr:sulfotransferase domain-containing protein [Vibrio sp. H11]
MTNNTYIYLTTQTSATDSMLRIFTTIQNSSFDDAKYIDKFLSKNSVDALKDADLPSDGNLHRFNLPTMFDVGKVHDEHKLIINYRDPRDHFCNVYHWRFSHPVRGESEEQRELRLSELRKKSVDDFVLEQANTKYYENIVKALTELDPKKFSVLTYARLCLGFDSFISKSADFLECELTKEIRDNLEVERIDNLSDNPRYIGNKWAGADVCPGRYKRELKPETINILNQRFEKVLAVMAEHDPDFATYYK